MEPAVAKMLAAAVQCHKAVRLHEADALYRQVLALEPKHPDALHLLGVLAHQTGKHDEAESLIRRAIAINPGNADYHCNLGAVLSALGRHPDAIAAYRQALALNPRLPEVLNNMGDALLACGRRDEAIEAWRAAVSLEPGFPQPHLSLARALRQAGRLQEAVATLQQALLRQPNDVQIATLLGNTLLQQGQREEAVAHLKRVVELQPRQAAGFNNLACALQATGRCDDAIGALRQALAIQPDYVSALLNLGNALKDCGELDEALACYDKALALKPDDSEVHGNRLFALHFHPDYDAAALHREHMRWRERCAAPLRQHVAAHRNDPAPERRIRIGFMSADLRAHVVGWNLLPMLRERDPARMEVFCYSDVVAADDMTAQLRSHADVWRSIVGMRDGAVADLVRSDNIDILIDLALHSAGNRLLVFARKPAPVQMTYLGYCSTTGLDSIDYRISDPFMDPPDCDLGCYTEQTLRLAGSYWCYQPGGSAPQVTPLPALTSGYVTFGCFNNFAKVSAATLDAWSQILLAVPGARLLIHAPLGEHRAKVRSRLLACGVHSEAVAFAARLPWDQYIRSYQTIDIAVDPFPYGGGITSCDALWMGVPLVTLTGKTAVGRGGTSILRNLGLAELIAGSVDEYIQIAAGLAGDQGRLADLRANLRSKMQSSILMDGRALAREMEAACRGAWRRWCERQLGHM